MGGQQIPSLEQLGETVIYAAVLLLSGTAAVGRVLRDQRRSAGTWRLVVSSFLFGGVFGVMVVGMTLRQDVAKNGWYAVAIGIGSGFVANLISAETILAILAGLVGVKLTSDRKSDKSEKEKPKRRRVRPVKGDSKIVEPNPAMPAESECDELRPTDEGLPPVDESRE